MGQNNPDERRIYLACQHIFRGSNSQVRKLKTIKGLIKQNEPALADILLEYDINRTSNVAKKLLEGEVFDSTLKAKIRFPELFDVSPTQSAEREVSEAVAAKDEANTVREISDKDASKETAVISPTELQDREASVGRFCPTTVQSLYPVYIHYRRQHLVLTTIQELLEESCFDFALRHFPQLLAQNGWDCPEAVELTEWIKILSCNSTKPIKILKAPLEEFIGLLRELRHSAVHRLRKTAAGVERLVENAELFLQALEDSTRSEKVGSLRRELRYTIEELKRNKDLFERRLLAQLGEIQNMRNELDDREKNVKEAMIREDLQCSSDIGEGLARFVRQVKIKNPKEAEEEDISSDMCSNSLDSEEEFLDYVSIDSES
ncbi:uncharacterized protein N7506_000179 [Penicillium brevicompactum]|uniref:uncharacterized protein n=1 Tax=Penicillium brevicompactum TaxID=5074 RepID=UPI00254033DF|nr:uncharacterized protein N7506_000179 [Penicillium brevicompactum]KAJ5346926.1 hypothetical protein N7506_000179 [Penicillium brevicompactum]